MYDRTKVLLAIASAIVAAAAMTAPAQFAAADEDPTKPAADMIEQKYNLDIKKLFASKCSWCHQSYGMKQADGPKLAGTSKTREQVITQIRNGKSPMPGFKNQPKQEEIEALADYIKALPKN